MGNWLSSIKAETIRSNTTPELTIAEATSLLLYQSSDIDGRIPTIIHFEPHTIQFASWAATQGHTVASMRGRLEVGVWAGNTIMVQTDEQAIAAVRRHYTAVGYTFGYVIESVDGVYIIQPNEFDSPIR
jgi:hypothetical protein